MLKALLKKQLTELKNLYLPPRRKSGALRSRAGIIGIAIVYLFCYASVAFAFFSMDMLLCLAYYSAGMEWMCFTVVALFSVLVGLAGSVFGSYSALFRAGDNDLLLSLPIPPRVILLSRLAEVYIGCLLFESVAYLPGMAAYIYLFGTGPIRLFCMAAGGLLLGGIITALSCLLGWLVALLNARSRHKSLTTVLWSLLLMAVYYVFYFRMKGILNSLAENALLIGETVQKKARPLYALGRALGGSLPRFAIFAAASLAVQALLVWVLSKTFLRIVTRSDVTAKKVYKAKTRRAQSPLRALVKKEFLRFTGTPAYLLNGGLGLFIMPALTVAALIKGQEFLLPFFEILQDSLPAEIARLLSYLPAFALGFIVSMDAISAPSLSLEGKSLWLLQSLPVKPSAAVLAKFLPHGILNGSVSALCVLALCLILGLSPLDTLCNVLYMLAFVLLSDALGLYAGLKKPNFDWTSETSAVKSGAPVAIALLGSWTILLLSAAALYFTRSLGNTFPLLLLLTAIAAAVLTTRLLRHAEQYLAEIQK